MTTRRLFIGTILLATNLARAAVPDFFTYQGRLEQSGLAYTGDALFRFAVVTSTGGVLYTNDGSAGPQPSQGVARSVDRGVFTVQVGSPASPGEPMQPIPAGVFADLRTFLRVWVAAPTTAPVEELIAQTVPVPHAHQFSAVPYSQTAQRAQEFVGTAPVAMQEATVQQNLQVQGSGSFRNGLMVGANTVLIGPTSGPPGVPDNEIRFTTSSGAMRTEGSNLLTLDAGSSGAVALNSQGTGSVGIGTAVPLARLHVRDVAGNIPLLRLEQGLGTNGSWLVNVPTAPPGTGSPFLLVGGFGPSERLTITATGWIGLNTLTPATTLHVAGNVLVVGSATISGPMRVASELTVQGRLSAADGVDLSSVTVSSFTAVGATIQQALSVGATATAAGFVGSGSGLGNLNAGALASGTVPDVRFSTNVARRDQSNIFSGSMTVNGDILSTGTVTAARFVGDGSSLTNLSAAALGSGSTNYIQNTSTFQVGAIFHVASGTVAGSLAVTRGDAATDIRVQNTAVGGRDWRLVALTSGPFQIQDRTSQSSRVTISTLGRVGIGTDVPGGTLHLRGPDLTNPMIRFEEETSGALFDWRFSDNAWRMTETGQAERLTLFRSGVGMGKTLLTTRRPARDTVLELNPTGQLVPILTVSHGPQDGATPKLILNESGDLELTGVLKSTGAVIEKVTATGTLFRVRGGVTPADRLAVDASGNVNVIGSLAVSGPITSTDSITATRFMGDGSGLTNLTTAALGPGSTHYIQNRDTLQLGATFYVASGTVAGSLTSGATMLAQGFVGSGSGLMNLSASALSTGTVPDVRLSTNVARRDQANTFIQDQVFQSTVTMTSRVSLSTVTVSSLTAAAFSVAGPTDARLLLRNPGQLPLIPLDQWEVKAETIPGQHSLLRFFDGNNALRLGLTAGGGWQVDGGLKVGTGTPQTTTLTMDGLTGNVASSGTVTAAGVTVSTLVVTSSATVLGDLRVVGKLTASDGVSLSSVTVSSLTTTGLTLLAPTTVQGALVVQAGTVTATGFVGSGSGLGNLNASALASGTVLDVRLSTNVARRDQANVFTDSVTVNGDFLSTGTVTAARFVGDGSGITSVGAGSANYIQNRDTLQAGATFYVASGTVAGPLAIGATATAAGFVGSGNGLANLNASALSTGTVSDVRLSTNVARRDQANTFTQGQTVSGADFVVAGGQTLLRTPVGTGGPAQLFLEDTVSGRSFALQVVQDGNLNFASTGTVRVSISTQGRVTAADLQGREMRYALPGTPDVVPFSSRLEENGHLALVKNQNLEAILSVTPGPSAGVIINSRSQQAAPQLTLKDDFNTQVAYSMLIQSGHLNIASGGEVKASFAGSRARPVIGVGAGQFRVDEMIANTGNLQGVGDVAEMFETVQPISVGRVVQVDPDRDGHVVVCLAARSPEAFGIVSSTGTAFVLGAVRSGVPVAMAGRVWAWVSTRNGPVRRGARLTSDGSGELMAADARTPSDAILGRALGALSTGEGLVEVLVTGR